METDILCLKETKIEDWSNGMVHQLWGNRWTAWVDMKASGSRGGIIVIWDKRSWNCSNSYLGSFSVTCCLESLHENFSWCFTGVYWPHTNVEREDFWKELGAIRGLWDSQWVIGGDFNACRFENERLNCTRRTRAMLNFSETISDLQLIDPHRLKEPKYTWSRGEDVPQASKIDRFLFSTEWNNSFQSIKQLVLPRVISDHKPLLLENGDWETTSSYFKFENMWLQ